VLAINYMINLKLFEVLSIIISFKRCLTEMKLSLHDVQVKLAFHIFLVFMNYLVIMSNNCNMATGKVFKSVSLCLFSILSFIYIRG